MDFDTLDVLYRSRQTILEILKDKGYVTAPYEKFGPFEIEKMASKDKSLNMEVRKDVADDFVGLSICRVEYAIPRVKNRIATFLSKLLKEDEEVAEEDAIDTSNTEFMVITLESINDTFDKAAMNQWVKNRLRIAFFDAHTLVSNPLKHILVPLHEVVPEAEHADLLKKYNAENKTKFPIIRFHEDIIGRILGLVPGSIVKITRPSPSAGEYTLYRHCV